MARSASVKDYMSKIVVRLSPDMDVLHALRILLEKDAPGGVVLDRIGNLVGVLTEKDCLKAALTATYHENWGGQVAEVMHGGVETVQAEDNIAYVAKLFIEKSFTHFPVVHENRLVGQISRRNVLKALEHLRHEA
jgi:CBS domain-containing protein